MKIWLDDVRQMPEGFDLHIKTGKEMVQFLRGSPKITLISFDHDLGVGLTGYDIAKLIEKMAHSGELSAFDWEIHSANPVGKANIYRALVKANTYWKEARDVS